MEAWLVVTVPAREVKVGDKLMISNGDLINTQEVLAIGHTGSKAYFSTRDGGSVSSPEDSLLCVLTRLDR